LQLWKEEIDKTSLRKNCVKLSKTYAQFAYIVTCRDPKPHTNLYIGQESVNILIIDVNAVYV